MDTLVPTRPPFCSDDDCCDPDEAAQVAARLAAGAATHAAGFGACPTCLRAVAGGLQAHSLHCPDV